MARKWRRKWTRVIAKIQIRDSEAKRSKEPVISSKKCLLTFPWKSQVKWFLLVIATAVLFLLIYVLSKTSLHLFDWNVVFATILIFFRRCRRLPLIKCYMECLMQAIPHALHDDTMNLNLYGKKLDFFANHHCSSLTLINLI